MKVELKNKIILGLWLSGALSILVLFVAASQKRRNGFCRGTKIEIITNNQAGFVTEKEVSEIINAAGTITDRKVNNIDLAGLETALKSNVWIKNAELYFDNNGLLHADIKQRQPIARLFSVDGSSHYLDANALRLPVKSTASARVLIVTGFPSNNEMLAHADSLVLNDVRSIAGFIYADSFWNAQIAQVNITNTGRFELVPSIGHHIITIGSAENLKEKFERLYTFYAKAWLQNGLDAYEKIDVRFDNQVVATRSGSTVLREAGADSLAMNHVDSIVGFIQDTIPNIRQ